MKSTGEVLGIGKDFAEALFKGLTAAKLKLNRTGGVFISVRNSDKDEIADIADRFRSLGFDIYATPGTAQLLTSKGFSVTTVQKISESPTDNNTTTLLESGKLSYVICTAEKGRNPERDGVIIRRKACILGIPCLTSLDTAEALAHCLKRGHDDGEMLTEDTTTLVDINTI